MYVYAKYVEDNKTIIVPVSDVKKFDPNLKYAVDKTFKVKYTDGSYYRAYILAVGESPEETEELANKKRFRKPTQYYERYESASGLSTEESETDQLSNGVENHTKKNSVNDTGKQNYRSILKEGLNAKEKVQDNVKLLETELFKANNKILQMEKKIEDLTQLNYKLQHKVIDKFKDLQLPPIKYNQEPSTEKKFQVGERYEGNVHLGREVWLPANIFDAIYRKKKDSIFVKELAMAVFGEEVLLNSSTLGQTGNRTRTVARPSLPPTQLLAIQDILRFRLLERGEPLEAVNKSLCGMDKIINEKIQDLRRLPRSMKQRNTNPQEEPVIEVEAHLQSGSIALPTELELVNDSILLEMAANAEIMLVGEQNAPNWSTEQ